MQLTQTLNNRRVRFEVSAATGWIALVISILASSTYFSLAKDLSGALSGMSLIFLSELVILATSIGTFGLLPIYKQVITLPYRQKIALLGVALLSGLIAPLLWYAGLHYTLAVNSVFFSKFETIALLLFAHFLLRERVSSSHLLAVIAVLSGMIVISLRGFSDGLSLQFGDALIMLSSGCYACGSVLFRKFLADVPPHTVIVSRSIIGIASFFLVAPFTGETLITSLWHLPAYLVPTLIGFALISRLLNMVSYYHALEHLPVTTISLVSSLDTIGGTIFASFYLGEVLQWYHILGGVFIMLGIVLLELMGTHRNERHLELHLRQRRGAVGHG